MVCDSSVAPANVVRVGEHVVDNRWLPCFDRDTARSKAGGVVAPTQLDGFGVVPACAPLRHMADRLGLVVFRIADPCESVTTFLNDCTAHVFDQADLIL